MRVDDKKCKANYNQMMIFCITKLELIKVNIPVKWQLRKILMDAMFITNKHQRPIGRKIFFLLSNSLMLYA